MEGGGRRRRRKRVGEAIRKFIRNLACDDCVSDTLRWRRMEPFARSFTANFGSVATAFTVSFSPAGSLPSPEGRVALAPALSTPSTGWDFHPAD